MQPSRREVLIGAATALVATRTNAADPPRIFDSHCHIIDHAFPVIENQGYLPPPYPLDAYLAAVRPLGVQSGAIVSGSFQGYDQTYLVATLQRLGAGWVGVTQLPNDAPDAEIVRLDTAGVRAVRFNILRGLTDDIDALLAFATRVHAIAGWHAEIYADAAALKPHVAKLAKLPRLAIDHMGMTEAGLPVLLDLVAAGVKTKATGFGRVAMEIENALTAIARADPSALVFGTDLPSTRAKRPFQPADIDLIARVLGADLANRALWDNGRALYRLG